MLEGARGNEVMKRFRLRLWAWLLRALQRRCEHRPEWQLADLRERNIDRGEQVRWCRVCGAVAIVHWADQEPRLRRPEPTWTTEHAQ